MALETSVGPRWCHEPIDSSLREAFFAYSSFDETSWPPAIRDVTAGKRAKMLAEILPGGAQ
jgi:hypothetical protein